MRHVGVEGGDFGGEECRRHEIEGGYEDGFADVHHAVAFGACLQKVNEFLQLLLAEALTGLEPRSGEHVFSGHFPEFTPLVSHGQKGHRHLVCLNGGEDGSGGESLVVFLHDFSCHFR